MNNTMMHNMLVHQQRNQLILMNIYLHLVINPSIEKAGNVFATNSRGTVIQSFQYSQRKCKIIGFHFVGNA